MKESTVQLIQYLTAALLVALLAYHVLQHTPVLEEGYRVSLEYENVVKHYVDERTVLALLLYAALFHGLNGLRAILLEVLPSSAGKAATILLILIGIAAAYFGTLTIVEVA